MNRDTVEQFGLDVIHMAAERKLTNEETVVALMGILLAVRMASNEVDTTKLGGNA